MQHTEMKEGAPRKAIEHEISDADTLVGLAMRYDVDVEDIKRVNKIFGDKFAPLRHITLKKKITIPTDKSYKPVDPAVLEALAKRKKIAQFRDRTKCEDDGEIKYYLEQSSWDLEKGIADYVADKAWAAEQERKLKAARSGCGDVALADMSQPLLKKVQ
mmetsp:Transcript_19685/g.33765  ORF Transcript_19685/g.33765 Transcript_19685/m.33765 type:complete len:159 (-) Transcript_19685:104-580(-)|eukprot:CAMPEP_0196667304 /NCGR_PEP_ID=MMETSP1086-20130531/65008_1 /TAXON_ID=77921 /ORGANISM="Cyanoptyche  gloeocystis , Strain SAG4.97" /LENGTH=158 /DNA_ID=CAMNT_0042004619 /DNA_START=27 /DNA_END=503 /DNA_ORIENTATION=+